MSKIEGRSGRSIAPPDHPVIRIGVIGGVDVIVCYGFGGLLDSCKSKCTSKSQDVSRDMTRVQMTESTRGRKQGKRKRKRKQKQQQKIETN
jgi:hypothetical protein